MSSNKESKRKSGTDGRSDSKSNDDATKKKRGISPGNDLPVVNLREASSTLTATTAQEIASKSSKKLKGTVNEPPSQNSVAENGPTNVEAQLPPIYGDIESAIDYLCRPCVSSEPMDTDLSKILTFRPAKSSDSQQLLSLYRESKPCKCANDDNANDRKDCGDVEDMPRLEVQLADALGDEDHPPFVHGIIVELWSNNEREPLVPVAGAALLSQGKDIDGNDCLRVEWLYRGVKEMSSSESELLRQRLFLRLSALAVLVNSTLILSEGGSLAK